MDEDSHYNLDTEIDKDCQSLDTERWKKILTAWIQRWIKIARAWIAKLAGQVALIKGSDWPVRQDLSPGCKIAGVSLVSAATGRAGLQISYPPPHLPGEIDGGSGGVT